ncbi:HPP family protein [Rouxiella chamberiensis]|uniref:HPP family protein n=1 Tax=Rouxiella chamberiensis TaxID=1513468 RepID=A0ABY7HT58_9GAMM|nr:HPP family protein [Rouxiella chamberiensis]WAT02593.1 HPP family protein [Rouxiella chamberiensis]
MNSLFNKFLRSCRHFWPHPLLASRRERFVGCLGAAIGIFITECLCRYGFGVEIPWLIAPMGASAVLMFAIPASPLAQPWAIVGGNLVASLVGVTCAQWIPDSGVAAAMAVALSIALMFPLRCIHPPSGAVAVTAVLGGPVISGLGYGFVLYPVLINSLLLTAVALVFNNALKRRYPHPLTASQPVKKADNVATLNPLQPVTLTAQDIHLALSARGEMVDIDEGDLLEIFSVAEQHARRRENLAPSAGPSPRQKLAS